MIDSIAKVLQLSPERTEHRKRLVEQQAPAMRAAAPKVRLEVTLQPIKCRWLPVASDGEIWVMEATALGDGALQDRCSTGARRRSARPGPSTSRLASC
jgi:hypothetical protein